MSKFLLRKLEHQYFEIYFSIFVRINRKHISLTQVKPKYINHDFN